MNNRIEHWYSKAETLFFNNWTVPFIKQGEGPVLLCIHGFPTSSLDFQDLFELLMNKYSLIAHDLIGLGRSSKPNSDISISDQVDLIEELIQINGFKEINLIAHDLGDTVAQELISRYNNGQYKFKINSCILLNGGLFPETHKPRLIQKLLLSPLGSFVARLSSKRTFVKTMRNICSNKISDSFLDDSWDLLISDNGRRMIPYLIKYMKERKIHRESWVNALKQAAFPIQLINGNIDPISGLHMAERYSELIPDPDIVHLEGLGHYPHVEEPELISKLIVNFHTKLNIF